MGGLKVCVIGGGSTYTPELIEGFIERGDELPVATIALMDIDENRLRVVGGLAGRMLRAAEADIELQLTTQRKEALEGADYVITQIRVGGLSCRIQDEKIPLQFGVVGQETTGPGGFAKALRTIPVLLNIAHDMAEVAPEAHLINFTNPSGIITEALLKYTAIPTIGLCNSPFGFQQGIAQQLGVAPERIQLDYVGLNHLSWIRGVRLDGEDVFSQVLEGAIAQARAGEPPFSPELLETLGMIPSYYLTYYYNHDQVVAEQRRAGKTRGEEVQEIEASLLELYADPNLKHKPKLLEKRGGAHYSTVAVAVISAIHHDKGEIHIVNTRNNGALPDLPPDCVVELPSLINRSDARAIPVAALPPAIRGLTQAVKAYEELTVLAAVEGDEQAALQALLAHPLVPSFAVAQRLWAAIKEANRAYLPQFGNADCGMRNDRMGDIPQSAFRIPQCSLSLVLGVDAGATKTFALVADEGGHILGFGEGGPGNHQVAGLEPALAEIRRSCEEALAQAGTSPPVDFGFFGLAGADLPVDFALLTPAIEGMGLARRVRIKNDTMVALRAGLKRGWGAPSPVHGFCERGRAGVGVAVICGTGFNAGGIGPDGREIQLPGLGTLSGDWGGGGDIAQEVIRLICRAWDGRGQPTMLTEMVLVALGFPSVEELISQLYQSQLVLSHALSVAEGEAEGFDYYPGQFDQRRLLALVPLVFEAAYEGDQVAQDLVVRVGTEVGITASAIIKRLGLETTDVEVVLGGSVFKGKGPLLVDTVTQVVHRTAPQATIVLPEFEPVVGAVFLALESLGVEVNDAVYANMRASLPDELRPERPS